MDYGKADKKANAHSKQGCREEDEEKSHKLLPSGPALVAREHHTVGFGCDGTLQDETELVDGEGTTKRYGVIRGAALLRGVFRGESRLCNVELVPATSGSGVVGRRQDPSLAPWARPHLIVHGSGPSLVLRRPVVKGHLHRHARRAVVVRERHEPANMGEGLSRPPIQGIRPRRPQHPQPRHRSIPLDGKLEVDLASVPQEHGLRHVPVAIDLVLEVVHPRG